jgi:hypothetical protein
MEEAEIKYLRKRLYVTDKAPGITIDSEGYVRVGLSSDMGDGDLIILAITLALKNKDWKQSMLKRVKEKMAGATTPTTKIERAFDLLKPPE